MFAIICFVGEDTVDYIPEEWLIGRQQCHYPKLNVTALKRKGCTPLADWKTLDIRILGYAGKKVFAPLLYHTAIFYFWFYICVRYIGGSSQESCTCRNDEQPQH
jgi:hypothetical protein